jgi:hypothetical protein
MPAAGAEVPQEPNNRIKSEPGATFSARAREPYLWIECQQYPVAVHSTKTEGASRVIMKLSTFSAAMTM